MNELRSDVRAFAVIVAGLLVVVVVAAILIVLLLSVPSPSCRLQGKGIAPGAPYMTVTVSRSGVLVAVQNTAPDGTYRMQLDCVAGLIAIGSAPGYPKTTPPHQIGFPSVTVDTFNFAVPV